jgi:mutator protein MutT
MKDHVALVLINKDKKILFVKRSMKKKTLPGIWSFPSGTIETRETVFETAVREAKEELGVEVEPKTLFARTVLNEFSVRLSFVLCEVKKGQVSIKEPNEIDKIEWMKFSEFFGKFSDKEIGHGLVWLKMNPDILNEMETFRT